MRTARPVVAVPGKDFIDRFNQMEYKLDALAGSMASVLESITILIENGVSMNTDVQALAAVVARTTTVQASAVQLLQLILSKLNAALTVAESSGDLTEVRSLTASLGSSTEALAAAVAANTVAEPASDPAPLPVEPAPLPVEPAPVPVEPAV